MRIIDYWDSDEGFAFAEISPNISEEEMSGEIDGLTDGLTVPCERRMAREVLADLKSEKDSVDPEPVVAVYGRDWFLGFRWRDVA